MSLEKWYEFERTNLTAEQVAGIKRLKNTFNRMIRAYNEILSPEQKETFKQKFPLANDLIQYINTQGKFIGKKNISLISAIYFRSLNDNSSRQQVLIECYKTTRHKHRDEFKKFFPDVDFTQQVKVGTKRKQDLVSSELKNSKPKRVRRREETEKIYFETFYQERKVLEEEMDRCIIKATKTFYNDLDHDESIDELRLAYYSKEHDQYLLDNVIVIVPEFDNQYSESDLIILYNLYHTRLINHFGLDTDADKRNIFNTIQGQLNVGSNIVKDCIDIKNPALSVNATTYVNPGEIIIRLETAMKLYNAVKNLQIEQEIDSDEEELGRLLADTEHDYSSGDSSASTGSSDSSTKRRRMVVESESDCDTDVDSKDGDHEEEDFSDIEMQIATDEVADPVDKAGELYDPFKDTLSDSSLHSPAESPQGSSIGSVLPTLAISRVSDETSQRSTRETASSSVAPVVFSSPLDQIRNSIREKLQRLQQLSRENDELERKNAERAQNYSVQRAELEQRNSELDERIVTAEDKHKQLQEEKQRLEEDHTSRMSELQSRRRQQQHTLRELEEKIKEAEARNNELRQRNAELDREIEKLPSFSRQ